LDELQVITVRRKDGKKRRSDFSAKKLTVYFPIIASEGEST
jgi:hypothetical protein